MSLNYSKECLDFRNTDSDFNLEFNRNYHNIQSQLDRIVELRTVIDNENSDSFVIESIDIAIASLIYWHNNVFKWHDLPYCSESGSYQNQVVDPRNGFDAEGVEWLGETIWNMAEADFWSGLVGGIGSFGNPGVIVGGALWGSAGAGIRTLWERPCP